MLILMMLQLNLIAINLAADSNALPCAIDFQYQKLMQREYELNQKRDRIEEEVKHLGQQIDRLEHSRDEQLRQLGETYKLLNGVHYNMQ